MTAAETGAPRPAVQAARARRAHRLLRYTALVFAAGFLVHNGDHFRRGIDSLTPEVLWAGSVAAVLSMVAIALALGGSRLAPLVAVAVGFPLALGVSAVHLLPRWSAFSDALPGGTVDALSYAAVLFEIGGALALGLAGAYALRRDGPS